MGSDPLTAGQVALFLGIVPVVTAWIYSEFLGYKRQSVPSKLHSDVSLVDITQKDVEQEALLESGLLGSKAFASSLRTQLWKFFTMDRTFLVENRGTLRAISEFGGLLFYFFLCDRTGVLGESEKVYSRDLFMFLFFLLIIASAFTSLKKHVEKSAASTKSILYLNRHQTEEWRGWMQVLFLMYHYFNAREIYNSIRVFIAAYVWMTGFGNFSYYYVRKDFSLGRFAQMMWRLNFLVFFACAMLNNDYMLYYICPMHTFFTLMVYCVLGVGHKYNEIPSVMAAKFVTCFIVVAAVWEIPGVFEFIWSPFILLMGFQDPRHIDNDRGILYEWHFRSGLDRYVWIVGMLYAYFHPTMILWSTQAIVNVPTHSPQDNHGVADMWACSAMVERWLEKLEELEFRVRVGLKAIVLSITMAVGYIWYKNVYKLEKSAYNALHPYTSWIPLTVYIVLRNFTQPLRNWSLTLFAWLGKITLETYIAQFHIWLRTSLPNGAPIMLLSIIPDYPLLNFMLTSSIYIMISYRLFELTSTLKSVFVPSKDNRRLGEIFLLGVTTLLLLYGISYLILTVPKWLAFQT